MASENKSSQKKPKKYTKRDDGYLIEIEEDGKTYNIFISNKEMTDIDFTKQLIRNRINMEKKNEINIKKLMETLV